MKKKLLALFMSAMCLTMALPGTVAMADGRRVVTLGADLSDEQRQAILRYFGIEGQNIQTLTITNADERAQLGSFVPLEQIGTYTFSCAYVNPTNSGGIQVKTANLTWVTSNMIASTLSTSGVVNCEVLAASPFEVSGTGALTGIIMAYESAVGENLEESKKELATQELITTTTIADSIGQQQATQIVNASKMQVIQGNTVKEGDTSTVNEGDTTIVNEGDTITINEGDTTTVNEGDTISQDDIDIIINQAAEDQGVTLSDEDRQLLRDLLTQIAQQDYNYEEMKETLERVESNMEQLTAQNQPETGETVVIGTETETPLTEASQPQTTQTETPETLPEDSILTGTDDSALGDHVVFDATDEEALPETEVPETQAPETQADTQSPEVSAQQTEASSGFDITTSDSYSSDPAPDTEASTAADDITIQTESPAAADDMTDQTESPAAADDMTDQTESPATTEDAAIQTESPAATEDITIQTESPAATEDMTDQTESMVAADNMTEQTEAPAGEDAAQTESQLLSLEGMVMEPASSDSNENQTALAGTDKVTLYLNTSDLAAGAGTLTVYNSTDDSTFDTINMNDSQRVVLSAIDSEKLTELGWTEGTAVTVFLTDPLAQSSEYYVLLSEGALTNAEGSSLYEAYQGQWNIQTAGYGVSLGETAEGFTAGSTVNASVILDGAEAGSAAVTNYDEAVITFASTEFTASGDLSITLNQPGEVSFNVTFYDGAGTELRPETYTLMVH